ncbi:MAG: class I tRNA ligase family protein, partial [Maribacter sp.]
ELPQPEASKLGIAWYTSKLNQTLIEIEDHFGKYRISDALMAIYKLVWDDYSSWLLEIIKPTYQQPIDSTTFYAVIHLFEQNLKLLHPFMPFLTEEVWQHIAKRTSEEALVVAQWPKISESNAKLISDFEFAAEVIAGIRTVRKEKNIPMKEALELSLLDEEHIGVDWDVVIAKLTNVSKITYVDNPVEGALTFRVKSNEYFIPMSGAIDVEAEIAKIQEELKYTEGFLSSVKKKLSNERFVNNAPEQVIAIERKKQADAEAKIETLEKSLASLG